VLDKFSLQLNHREIMLKLQTEVTIAKSLDKNLLLLPILRCTRNNNIPYNKIYKIPHILSNKRNKLGKHILPQHITLSKTFAPKLAARLCSSRMKAVFTDDDIRNFN
jgi:hypothetical protein